MCVVVSLWLSCRAHSRSLFRFSPNEGDSSIAGTAELSTGVSWSTVNLLCRCKGSSLKTYMVGNSRRMRPLSIWASVVDFEIGSSLVVVLGVLWSR